MQRGADSRGLDGGRASQAGERAREAGRRAQELSEQPHQGEHTSMQASIRSAEMFQLILTRDGLSRHWRLPAQIWQLCRGDQILYEVERVLHDLAAHSGHVIEHRRCEWRLGCQLQQADSSVLLDRAGSASIRNN